MFIYTLDLKTVGDQVYFCLAQANVQLMLVIVVKHVGEPVHVQLGIFNLVEACKNVLVAAGCWRRCVCCNAVLDLADTVEVFSHCASLHQNSMRVAEQLACLIHHQLQTVKQRVLLFFAKVNSSTCIAKLLVIQSCVIVLGKVGAYLVVTGQGEFADLLLEIAVSVLQGFLVCIEGAKREQRLQGDE